MKIVHIVSTYPPYYGGMGNVVFQMVQQLADRGHEVQVFTPGYYPGEEIKKPEAKEAEEHAPEVALQIETVRRFAPVFSYGNAAYIPQVEKELGECDIVHLHYPFFGVGSMVRRWRFKNPDKRLVVTYHMDARALGFKGMLFKWYTQSWMPKILNAADAALVSSFDYAEVSDAQDIYKNSTARWHELPFGVDIERFQPREKPQDLFAQHGLDPEKPTLLFVGGMDAAHYFKGIPVLLKALLFVREKRSDIQAVLVGEGELKNSFENMAKSYRLENAVQFVGRVPDELLPRYYNMADLFVLPSTTASEAFGMVVLEAMASGVPVIASDLPGVRTVALDAGILCTPSDHGDFAEAILGFFTSDNDRVAWRIKARAIAEQKYAWGPIVERLEGIYQQVVGK